MIKTLFLFSFLSFCIASFAEGTNEETTISSNEATPVKSTVNSDSNSEGIVNAFRCTGNQVICRTGPGKQYSQVIYDGQRMYLNKGDIVLDGHRVKNGYRLVFFPGEGEGDFWIATQYLKACKWDDGYVY